MSSSIDINSDEITTATCSKDDNDSTEDIALASAKQLTLQIDHLSIENEESHILYLQQRNQLSTLKI